MSWPRHGLVSPDRYTRRLASTRLWHARTRPLDVSLLDRVGQLDDLPFPRVQSSDSGG